MTKYLFATVLLLFCSDLLAQPPYENDNRTYLDNITTVRFHIDGFPSSYPVIDLNGGARLRLSFDDTNDEVRRYTYRIVHCNQDWTPSNLGPLEYTRGFAEDNIEDYDFSFRTLAQYIHYELTIPNRNIQLTKSGNYLLIITEDEDDEVTAITRRFMVTENLATISGVVGRATNVNEIHSHQEVDFVANAKQLRLRNPLQELSATVVQNGRWDNAIFGIKPNLINREIIRFDYQGKVSFKGGNEFRNLDIRSIAAPRSEVVEITNEGTHYGMIIAPEEPRDQEIFLNYADVNGDFINFRFDRPTINLADEFLAENYDRLSLEFTGDYIDVTLIFHTGRPLDDDVYLFGGFTEFRKQDRFKMVYNPAISSYIIKTMLKQGFYNYWFVTDRDQYGNKVEGGFSLDKTEGSFDETENDYIVLVYYRPIGGR
ncbi:MAG: DUF5103 domain-containing protein, partial [Bacteroidota bacterium]